MPTNVTTTILLLLPDQLVRADFQGAGPSLALAQVERVDRPLDALSTAALVDQAISVLPGRPGKKTWLLDAELWTQQIELPEAAVKQSSHEEITHALAFEAEALSGIPAQRGVLAHCPAAQHLPHRRWIMQVAATELEQVDQAVRTRGGRLAGLLHPAGLASALDNTAPSSGATVELWANAIVATRPATAGQGNVDRHLIAAPPQQPGVLDELNAWLGDGTPIDALLVAPGLQSQAQMLTASSTNMRDLDAPAALDLWLTDVARALGQSNNQTAPIIRPKARDTESTAQLIAAIALFALVTVACAAHALITLRSTHAARAAVEQAGQPQAQQAQAEQQLKQDRAAVTKAQASVDQLRQQVTHWHDAMVTQRKRWPMLLQTLSQHRDETAVITSLTSAGSNIHLDGVCVDPQAPHRLAQKLGAELENNGWTVGMPTRTQKPGTTNAWDFRLTLQSAPVSNALPATSAPPAAQSSPDHHDHNHAHHSHAGDHIHD